MLTFRNHHLHADRCDMPARSGQPAKQRFSPLLFIKMEALRIELAREFLDQFGGEGERSQLSPLADHHVLEEAHQPACSASIAARRRTMIGESHSHTTCPAAFLAIALKVTMPVS